MSADRCGGAKSGRPLDLDLAGDRLEMPNLISGHRTDMGTVQGDDDLGAWQASSARLLARRLRPRTAERWSGADCGR